MALIIVLIFLAVFVVAALLVAATHTQTSSPKQVQATLDSALDVSQPLPPEKVDIQKEDSLSSIPWVHAWLAEIDAAVALQRLLDQAGLSWTPSALGLISAGLWLAAIVGFYILTDVPSLALLLGSIVGVGPFFYVRHRRAARFRRFEEALPGAIDLMVSALRAGHSVSGAIGIVATESKEPIRREFNLCYEEQNFGVDLRTSMENLMQRVPVADMRIIATAILIQKESGGNLAEVLDKTAYLVRERFSLQAQMRAHTAQSRTTASILTFAPFAVAAALYVLNPNYLKPFFNKPAGRNLLTIAVVLNLLGAVILRRVGKIRA